MNIDIELTEAESKALAYVVVDPIGWATNAVKERCRLAIEEIFQMEVKRMLADPDISEIPADREAVVLAANLPTLAERQAAFDAQFINSIGTE